MKNIYRTAKVMINGRHIAVMISGDEQSIKTKPYILFIPGGPGCSYKAHLPQMNKIIAYAESKKSDLCNFIFFDPLGAGDSDDAVDPNAEYTMTNFNEIAAQVVEKVKEQLNLKKMDVRVWGVSFGSMTALTLPLTRPEWLSPQSDIHLRQIIPVGFLNGWETHEHILERFDQQFRGHPNYHVIRMSIEEWHRFEMTEKDILKANFTQAPLYSRKAEEMMASFSGQILQKYPRFVIGLMKLINRFIHSDDIEANLAVLEMNCKQGYHFQKNKFDNIDVSKLVLANKALYSSIPICFFGGAQDIITPPREAELIQAQFPNMGSIVFNSRHQIEAGPEYIKIIHDLLLNSSVDQNNLEQLSNTTIENEPAVINRKSIPTCFQQQLALLSQSETLSSTGEMLQKLGAHLSSVNSQENKVLVSQEPKKIVLSDQGIHQTADPSFPLLASSAYSNTRHYASIVDSRDQQDVVRQDNIMKYY